MKPLFEITIKDYPIRMKVADKRRPKYYKKNSKIPKKYQDRTKFNFDDKGRLVDLETNEPLISNPRSAGTPRYLIINGQKLHNFSYSYFDRNKIMHHLKDFFSTHLSQLPPFQDFPLIIRGEVYRPWNPNDRWDVDNMQAPYVKAFHDALTDCGLIPDDMALYISGPLSFRFTPADEFKFVIKFYHDDRSVWKKYQK